MNKTYDCEIIMDLLPSYMDQIVSEETEAVIKEHLAHCDSCREIFEQMNCDITLQKKRKRKKRKRPGKKSLIRIIILGYLLFLALVVMLIILDITLTI